MSLELSLTHRFRNFALDVQISAPAGVTALSGPSGSGKSTIFQMVAGLMRPDRGSIRLNGEVLFDSEKRLFVPPHRRRLGCVFQEPRLFPHLSVAQNLRYGRPPRARVAEGEITELLGITHLLPRSPGALSGGEAQRVAIGRALLSEPDFLLMDEPLSALDDTRRSEILPWLEDLRDYSGVPILYISHSMAEVARLATTLVFMRDGRVTAAGPAADLLADPQSAQDQAGALIRAVMQRRTADGLNELITAQGLTLWIAGPALAVGARLRLQIPSRDITLARERPEGFSALNIWPAEVVALTPAGEGEILVSLKAGGEKLLAQITARSAQSLELAPGAQVQAVLKAVALTGRG